jgi:hypothetical protein
MPVSERLHSPDIPKHKIDIEEERNMRIIEQRRHNMMAQNSSGLIPSTYAYIGPNDPARI